MNGASSYLAAFVAMSAVCFGVQTLALRMSGGRTVKSESNYFSSIARIQTGAAETPRIMLLGSSMTGRLADRAQGLPGVVNLGCDGGSAVVTLRAMDSGHIPVAPVLIIEGNTLSYALEDRGREIAAALGSDWFELGTHVRNFSATARPTAFVYSWLMARRSGGMAPLPEDGIPLSSRPERLDPGLAPLLAPDATALVDELTGIFRRLEKRGCRILLTIFPPGVRAGSVQGDLPRTLACKSGVFWWDLTEGLPPECVGFTDGLHLDAPSAAKVLSTLVKGADAF